MKTFLQTKLTNVLAGTFLLLLLCLPQNEIFGQCPADFFITMTIPAASSSCNNGGTTDLADDLLCFTNFEFTTIGTPPEQFGNIFIDGTYIGLFNSNSGSTYGDGVTETCISAFDPPFVAEIFFDNGCVKATLVNVEISSSCFDCEDEDGDGVCNDADICPIGNDLVDTDGDTIPDDCDLCLNGDDNLDSDMDGVPDACDICEGSDTNDMDGDNTPDGCDICPGFDDQLDADGDIIPDDCDLCPGFDDLEDTDSDGVPDGCDSCPGSESGLVVDATGCAPCIDFNTFEFQSNNIVCDDQGTADPSDDIMCFTTFLFTGVGANVVITDATIFVDGVPTGNNLIAGGQGKVFYYEQICVSAVLPDFDVTVVFSPTCDFTTTVPNPFDGAANGGAGCSCPDSDSDGICDSVDQCSGSDDNIDFDGDGVPDGCDPCPNLANVSPGDACPSDGDDCTDDGVVDAMCECSYDLIDTDGDGVCDLDDICEGSDDGTDSDGDGIPDGCDPCPNLADVSPGDACPSDGDDCTDDGVVDASCGCSYALIDTDGDGVCDLDDICEGSDDGVDSDGDGVPDGCDPCPSMANMSPGDSCPSDGDDCTDDGLLSDTCECTSTPIDSPECNPTEECEVCDSNGNNTCYEYIKQVKLGCYSKWSGNNGGYGDFTGHVWDLHCGYWYGLTLKPGFSYCAYYENWGVWIDWNQDCDFDDADEFVGQACHWGNIYGQISVPNHAVEGNTTMRVSMSYDGFPDTCDNLEYGEVEDYTINVICGSGHGPISTMAIAEEQALIQSQSEHLEDEQGEAMLRPGYVGTDLDRTLRFDLAKDLEKESNLLVYPNPAIDYVNISINSEIDEGVVSVYDNVGRTVYQVKIDVEQTIVELDVSSFAAGLYSVALEIENSETVMKKFVVTR